MRPKASRILQVRPFYSSLFNFEGTLLYLQMYLENWIEESKATERAASLGMEMRHKKASSKVENFFRVSTIL